MAFKITGKTTLKAFSINDLLKEPSDDELSKYSMQMVVSTADISNHLEIFLRYAKKVDDYICKDYESAALINKLMKEGKINNKTIILLDDNELRDRSYIDLTEYSNIMVPDTYVMWGVKHNNVIGAYTRLYHSGEGYGIHPIKHDDETINEVKRVASMISEFPEDLTDVEKMILVSNYLQMYDQFIEGEESTVGDERYILDQVLENSKLLAEGKAIEKLLETPKTALMNHFGVCSTFAYASTLLLNNPWVHINTKTVAGPGHFWNAVQLDDKLYQVDNSRAISRGKNRMPEALRATKFNTEYLLFGQGTSRLMNHEQIYNETILPTPLRENDFDRNYIDAAVEHLDDTGLVSFEYGDKAFYPSHKLQ